MSIIVEELIIYLDTGIPNSTKDDKEPINLTSSLIYIPNKGPPQSNIQKGGLNKDKDIEDSSTSEKSNVVGNYPLNKNPFITPTIRYDEINLQPFFLTGYKNIVSFFFNKKLFTEKLNSLTRGMKLNKVKIKKEEEDYKDKMDTIEFNINFMLNKLFPTNFPSKNNIVSTFNQYILNSSGSNSYKDTFNNLFKNDFSYLKLDSKVYTISKISILDDMINNPFYRKIVNLYINFSNSSLDQQTRIKNDLIKNFKILMFKLEVNSVDDITKNIEPKKEYHKNNIKNLNITNYLIQRTKNGKLINGFQKSSEDADIKLKTYNGPRSNVSSTTISNQEILVNNLKIIVENLSNLKDFRELSIEIIDKDIDDKNLYNMIEDKVDELFTYIKNINEAYEKISSNSNISIGIDNDFEKDFKEKIKILNKEVTTLSYLKKISKQYLDKKTTSLNFTNEDDKDFIDFANKKYPSINKFIEELKNNIVEKRKSSNRELQKIIENFYEKKEDYEELKNKNTSRSDTISFSDLINKINEELIEVRKKLDYFNDEKKRNIIKTGINLININNSEAPHYEIYLALDLFEGEINSENVGKVKCEYRSLLLGQETQNSLERNNSNYSIEFHRIFVPMIIDNKEGKNKKVKNKEEKKKVEKKKGGKKSKKKTNHIIRNKSKRRKI